MRMLTLAKKDLLLLVRAKSSLFFTFVWPFLIAIFFGVIFSGGGGESAKPLVAVVDQDHSEGSLRFIAELSSLDELTVDVVASADAAREWVRTRKRTAAVIIPSGFGAARNRLFHGESPRIGVMIDPSRNAEEAMINGLLQGLAGQGLAGKITDPEQSRSWLPDALAEAQQDTSAQGQGLHKLLSGMDDYLQSKKAVQQDAATEASAAAKASSAETSAWEPLVIEHEPVQRKRSGPQNSFAITFPQGMLWGIVGCIMSFATSLVLERVDGTLLRLRSSPMADWEVMAGKALACVVAIALITTALALVARFVFAVQPNSWPLLTLAVVCAAVGFTGIMMFVSSLSSKVAGVSGAGWAMLMPMMMLGGGMIPLFMMPRWMEGVSSVSPVKWAILAFEGAIWRDFSVPEMLLPCAILLAVGVVFFGLGTRLYARRGL